MAAVTSLMRAQQIVLARVEEVLRPFDLTFARYEVLMLMLMLLFGRSGSLPLSRLGDRLQVHPTSVTNAVDRLEAQGLVRRSPHPRDRRATLAGARGQDSCRVGMTGSPRESCRAVAGSSASDSTCRARAAASGSAPTTSPRFTSGTSSSRSSVSDAGG